MKKTLPVEEKRIIACLSYLKMLVLNSEKDGTHDLIPHSSLRLGTCLNNISIINAYTDMDSNGFRSRFSVSCWGGWTVYQFKTLICYNLSYR